jgi:hypothetical protein
MRIAHLAGGMVLAVAALTAPTTTQAHADVIVGVAPPAARVEVVPAPRVNYVWAPGYWRWNGHRYFWVAGYWVPARHGYRWVPSHWSPYGPRWRYVPGYWAH